MCDLLCNELYKVWYKLMKTRIGTYALQGSFTEVVDFWVIITIENCGTYFVEEENELFGDNVFDERFEGKIVVAGEGREGRVGTWAFGYEVIRAGFCCRWILGDRRLNAFNC